MKNYDRCPVKQQYNFTIPVKEVPMLGECVRIVMDSSFREWGIVLRAKNNKCLHCWVWLIGNIFSLHKKHTTVYVVPFPGTIMEDAAVMVFWDKSFLLI
jgi:hypothetical protein